MLFSPGRCLILLLFLTLVDAGELLNVIMGLLGFRFDCDQCPKIDSLMIYKIKAIHSNQVFFQDQVVFHSLLFISCSSLFIFAAVKLSWKKNIKPMPVVTENLLGD